MKSSSAANSHESLPADDLDVRFGRLIEANRGALARLDIGISLWQALARFRGECSERTFLFRVAQNRAFSWEARRGKIESTNEELPDRRDPRPDPEQELLEHERENQLAEAIWQLPLIYREVLTLALEGMSYGEISAITGISESNVGVRLNRARQIARENLEERSGKTGADDGMECQSRRVAWRIVRSFLSGRASCCPLS
jgi:RNA polymerase sigma factor (sigma-70 family)